MAGRRKQRDFSSDFWCIRCGKKGIPVARPRGHIREKGHRKALYCIHCKMKINHIETRNEEEKLEFLRNFAAGMYAEEAERSAEYARRNFL